MAPLNPPARTDRAPHLCALRSALAAASAVAAMPCGVAQDPGPTPELRTFHIEPDARGDGPRGIAFVRGGTEVAVLHTVESELRFFSARDGEDLGAVALGRAPLWLAATSDGELAIVLDYASSELVLVDVVARTVVGRHTVPTDTARGLLVTPDDRYVVVIPFTYIPQPGSPVPPAGIASVFDLSSRTLSHTFTCDVRGTSAVPAALSGDGRRLLVCGRGAKLFDLGTGAVLWQTDPWRSGTVPNVWLDHTGDRALWVQFGEIGTPGGLFELEVPSLTLRRRSVHYNNQYFTAFVVTPDGRHVLWGGWNGTRWIDLATNEERNLPIYWETFAATSSGEYAIGESLVEALRYGVVDMRLGAVTTTFAAKGPRPHMSAAGPGNRVAFIDIDSERMAVAEVEQVSPMLVFQRSSGPGVEADGCRDLVLSTDGHHAVTFCPGSQNALVSRLVDGALVAEVPLAHRPFGVAVGGDTLAVLYNGGSSCGGPDRIEVYGLSPPTFRRVIVTPVSFTLYGVSPDGRYVYATDAICAGEAALVVLDTFASPSTPPARSTLPSAVHPDWGTLSSSGRWLLLPLQPTQEWAVVDTTLLMVSVVLPRSNARGFCFVDDDRTLFLAEGSAAQTIREYDLASGSPTLRASYSLPNSVGAVWRLADDGRGERVWVLGIDGVACLDRRTGVMRTVADPSQHSDLLAGLGPHAFVVRDGVLERYFDDGQAVQLIEAVEAPEFGDWSDSSQAQLSRELGLLVSLEKASGRIVAFDLAAAPPRRFCAQPNANSTGQRGALDVAGPRIAFGVSFQLCSTELPPGVLAVPIVGPTATTLPLASGAVLCVGPASVRLGASATVATPSGEARFTLEPTGLRLPSGPSLDHGATWCFQVWHRDVAPSGSALTDALALYFR